MTYTERIASKALRANPPIVHCTDEWLKANGGRVPLRKRRGELLGICNGKLRIRVDGNKYAQTFHTAFWKLA